VSHSADLIGHNDYTCEPCLYSGYINCFESVSLDGPRPEPLPGKDGPVDLLTLESTKTVDEDSKFREWGDWESRVKELHRRIEMYINRKWKCSRFEKGGAIISKYALFGESSFC
jgi:hypothetical protein